VTIDVGLEGNSDVSSAVRHEINLQHALVKYSRNRAMGLSIETPQLQSRGLATGAARFSPCAKRQAAPWRQPLAVP